MLWRVVIRKAFVRAMVLVLALTCVLNSFHVHSHVVIDNEVPGVTVSAQLDATAEIDTVPDTDSAKFASECASCALLGHLLSVPPIGLSMPASVQTERFIWVAGAVPTGRSYTHHRPPIGIAT